ncbi:MAG: hypothetical protein KBG83_08090 [Bacteroidetes bacterium]|nr:hypothetical protein [Bacteroidota bacterium]
MLTSNDIKKIAQVLKSNPKRLKDCFRIEIGEKTTQRKLSLEIFPNIPIGNRRGDLISVYTPSAHLQLHFCTGYVVSDVLGEVTFVGESNGKISGLTIEREGGCSLYANVDRGILSGDFTTFGPEVMLSSVALSLTESILPEERKQRKSTAVKNRQRSKRF